MKIQIVILSGNSNKKPHKQHKCWVCEALLLKLNLLMLGSEINQSQPHLRQRLWNPLLRILVLHQEEKLRSGSHQRLYYPHDE